MAVYIAIFGLREGIAKLPLLTSLLRAALYIGVIWLLKRYFGGAVNSSERVMHGKVIMLTGGTSGIGAEVAKQLAQRGAQLVLLTQYPLNDPFLVEYIFDLHKSTGNRLITAEQVDLGNLHSIRQFATKWVDNAPPRRLDMVILCANAFPTRFERGEAGKKTADGLESAWGVNYIANFHLLSILSPALRAQPADRDVRVIFATCASYMGGSLPGITPDAAMPSTTTSKKQKKEKDELKLAASAALASRASFGSSKLALMTFAHAFQKHLSTYARPDKQPMNARVLVVDPGWTRTPGMRRHLTLGSLWGLLVYLVTWPLWWLVLKSPVQGSQTFLWATMDGEFSRIRSIGNVITGEKGDSTTVTSAHLPDGVLLLKECKIIKPARVEVEDEVAQKRLWEETEKLVEAIEKESAQRRAREKAASKSKPSISEDKQATAPQNGGPKASGSETNTGQNARKR